MIKKGYVNAFIGVLSLGGILIPTDPITRWVNILLLAINTVYFMKFRDELNEKP